DADVWRHAVLPGEEVLTKATRIFDRAEAVGKSRPILQGHCDSHDGDRTSAWMFSDRQAAAVPDLGRQLLTGNHSSLPLLSVVATGSLNLAELFLEIDDGLHLAQASLRPFVFTLHALVPGSQGVFWDGFR